MNITVIAFAVCLLVALAFLFAMTWQALSHQRRAGFTQSGDTSLGGNSIHWMAGIALSLAVWVCFFVI